MGTTSQAGASKSVVLLAILMLVFAGAVFVVMFAFGAGEGPGVATSSTSASASAAPTEVPEGGDVAVAPPPESASGQRAPLGAPEADGAEALRGIVVDGEGRPLAGLKVGLVSVGKQTERTTFAATSGFDGTIAWHGLSPGPYVPSGAGYVVDEPSRIDLVADVVPYVRFVCRLDLVLAGRVIDAADEPVKGVSVIVEDFSGAEVGKANTDAEGAFRLSTRDRTITNPQVRLWVYSRGRFAMAAKLEAAWNQTDLVLRVALAPLATLLVFAEGGVAVRNYRLWIDLAPADRAATPWITEGWIGFPPGSDPSLPGLGLVPQRLSVFPVDQHLACVVVDVPGGDACRDQRIQLPATAELLVRTEPPVVGAVVRVLRVPANMSGRLRSPEFERARMNPLRQDGAVVLGERRTDASGSARIRGGMYGEAVTVTVVGENGAGEADTVLAAQGELVVTVHLPATLDVVLANSSSVDARGLMLASLRSDGEVDRLGRAYPLSFGGPPGTALLSELRMHELERELQQKVAQALMKEDVPAMHKLIGDPATPPAVRARLEGFVSRDRSRCHLERLPSGRYRIVRPTHLTEPDRSLLELTLAPGERAEHFLDLTTQGAIDLQLRMPTDPRLVAQALVDDASGALVRIQQPRPGPTRLLAVSTEGGLWLSRDVVELPGQGVFVWTPDLAPMRVTLRLRTARGAPVAGRAVSRVAASDVTSGWHGKPLGLTDVHGETTLRGDAAPFKLRVDGVGALLGPFAPDLRQHEQVIEVEVPER